MHLDVVVNGSPRMGAIRIVGSRVPDYRHSSPASRSRRFDQFSVPTRPLTDVVDQQPSLGHPFVGATPHLHTQVDIAVNTVEGRHQFLRRW